jgi:hypothetical protein
MAHATKAKMIAHQPASHLMLIDIVPFASTLWLSPYNFQEQLLHQDASTDSALTAVKTYSERTKQQPNIQV